MKEIKQKLCKDCNQQFKQYNTIQVRCVECAIKKGNLTPVKPNYAKIKREKLDSLDTKKQTYVKKVNAIKVIFQKWIRERDKNEPCISCGSLTSIEWHAGHFYKAENYSGLIFDERNCRKQCKKCNVFLDGNQLEYHNRLKEKFGTDYMEQLRLDAYLTKVKTYTEEELEDIKQKYK
jgi:hypothetical protein